MGALYPATLSIRLGSRLLSEKKREQGLCIVGADKYFVDNSTKVFGCGN